MLTLNDFNQKGENVSTQQLYVYIRGWEIYGYLMYLLNVDMRRYIILDSGYR